MNFVLLAFLLASNSFFHLVFWLSKLKMDALRTSAKRLGKNLRRNISNQDCQEFNVFCAVGFALGRLLLSDQLRGVAAVGIGALITEVFHLINSGNLAVDKATVYGFSVGFVTSLVSTFQQKATIAAMLVAYAMYKGDNGNND